MESFSIIVTTKRGPKVLENLFINTHEESELIIIDSNYSEKTKQWLSEQDGYKQIVYAPCKPTSQNWMRDFSQSLNTAISLVENDWIVRADDYIEFKPDFFQTAEQDVNGFDGKFVVIGQKAQQYNNEEKFIDYMTQRGMGGDFRYVNIENPSFTFSFGLAPLQLYLDLNGYDERYDSGWGCFDGKVLIDTDKGKLPIAQIVNEKLPVRVLSYNIQNNKFEYKTISNYFKGSTTDWYSIKTLLDEKNRTTGVTGEHPLLTRSGWESVCNLKNNDEIAIRTLILNSTQREIIIASLLGDASLEKWRRNYRICEGHSSKQKDYLLKKYTMLNIPFNASDFSYWDDRWNIQIEGTHLKTKANIVLNEFADFYDVIDGKKIKRIRQKYLDQLGILGLSIWMMDDGCFTDSGALLYTDCFTFDEVELIKNYFKDTWNLNSCIRKRPGRTSNQYYIAFNSDSKKWMLKNLFIEWNRKDRNKIFKRKTYINKSKYDLQWIKIEEIKKLNLHSTIWRYNLDIADNHNYIANNIIAHNCEDKDFLHRALVKSYTAILDKNLMGYGHNHKPAWPTSSFPQVIYEVTRSEIECGKHFAYNSFNLKELRKQQLKEKEKWIIQ